METLHFDYPGRVRLRHRAHVGVVASGDLEVLIEPSPGGGTHVHIETRVNGFGAVWRAVLDRFFQRFDGIAAIEINDCGASPGTVMLRLQQAAQAAGRLP